MTTIDKRSLETITYFYGVLILSEKSLATSLENWLDIYGVPLLDTEKPKKMHSALFAASVMWRDHGSWRRKFVLSILQTCPPFALPAVLRRGGCWF